MDVLGHRPGVSQGVQRGCGWRCACGQCAEALCQGPEGGAAVAVQTFEFTSHLENQPGGPWHHLVFLSPYGMHGGMQEKFQLDYKESWVLELDSSSPEKFSRHLILRIPGAAFQNNFHVGAFVKDICAGVEKEDPDNPAQQLMINKVHIHCGQSSAGDCNPPPCCMLRTYPSLFVYASAQTTRCMCSKVGIALCRMARVAELSSLMEACTHATELSAFSCPQRLARSGSFSPQVHVCPNNSRRCTRGDMF